MDYGDSVGNIPSELSGISMPNHEKAITPKEKFLEYSLNLENPNARGKAEAYEKSLGFNKDNADGLIIQIEKAVKDETVSPIEISKTEFGVKYKFGIVVSLYKDSLACEVEIWDEHENPIDVVTYLQSEIEKIH